jgi:hypothetical protein
MSAITQAIDGLLAGLLLPATRLLWIHGLFKMVVEGLAPVCRLPADCAGRLIAESNQMRRPKASWDRADFEVWGQREVLERGHFVR